MDAQQPYLVILGAGESGVGAALLAQQKGWRVLVSDGGKIKPQFREELESSGIAYEEGRNSMDEILAADRIVKSPGISEKTELMKQIRKAGKRVSSEIEFAYDYKGDSKIIAITGSNGKSTTTKLLYHILSGSDYDVSMVGNIGYGFARQIAKQPTAWYVIEVSSFQLDDIQEFRPDIALLLNITPDHLDRYDYKMENYVGSKFRITENQRPEDFLILNKDDREIRTYLEHHNIKAKIIYFTMNTQQGQEEGASVNNDMMHIEYGGEHFNTSVYDLTIQGKHNQHNGMAAGIGARIAGIRVNKLKESLQTFQGLDHRLQFVATVRGVDFVNDSKATNINSVWFALESMKTPTILILGGQDKGNDYNEIKDLVMDKVKAIICLGVDNSAIHEALGEAVPEILDTTSAQEAVKIAFSLASSGDTVLLAPGCASFDRFQNFEDRGTQFMEAVRAL